MLNRLLVLYRQYPARANGAIASGVVGVALLLFGLDLDHDTVLKVVAFLVPLVVAEATHRKVSPA